jgi:ribosomal protein L40E
MGKAICIYCGYENDLENESCTKCGGRFDEEEIICPKCKSRLENESKECSYCTQKEKLSLRMEEEVLDPYEKKNGKLYIFRSVNLLSFLFFWGALGLVFGIILGALIGVAKRYVETIQFFPEFLKALHGKLLGSVVFGFFGGVLGFILFAIAGFVLAVLINVLLSFVGGIKIRVSSKSISDD